MFFSSRFFVVPVLAVIFFAAGCERKEPVTARKFKLLVEENARLVDAVAALDPANADAKFVSAEFSEKAAQQLAAENDRLREILAGSDRTKALAANRTLREEIERQVVAIRGLEFKAPVDYQVLSRKQIKQTMAGKLAEVFSEQEFKDMTEAMAAVGLLPAGYPLREKYIDLLGEQVAAFYDQHAHKLFMYEDASLENAQNRVVLAHELTHALQDQHFGLKSLPLEIKNNDDRAVAASALVEGEATLVMSEYMLKNMSRQMLKDSVVSSFTQNMKQLETAPRYLREMLVFPYLRGQEFCAVLFGQAGYEGVSKAYAQPPSSTAQILHPQKFLTREEPVAIEWADLKVNGEAPIADNCVGEMGMRILFAEWLDAPTGERAAAGWRGDRYLYYAGGQALVWKTVWASEKEAQEFFDAEKKLLEQRHRLTNPKLEAMGAVPGSSIIVYSADAPRFIRLRFPQTEAHEVIVIDAANAEWAQVLGERF